MLQQDLPGRLTVIYDADRAGCFIPALAPPAVPPAGRERILIASTGAQEAAFFSPEGDLSFSRFFWTTIKEGSTVYNAFSMARQSLSFLSRKTDLATRNP